ncbi:hypothetical protein VCSRO147_0608 [Vibrio cholerae]|nr:hypothetical protein VCSRO147_0608 [Vibrio cholerae]
MSKEKIEQLTKLHMSGGVIEQVIGEMVFQDLKWGESRTLNNHVWDSILSEEVGEVSEEAVLVWNAKLGIKKGFASKFTLEQQTEKLRAELIQVAAVAIQWIEAIDRENQELIPKEEINNNGFLEMGLYDGITARYTEEQARVLESCGIPMIKSTSVSDDNQVFLIGYIDNEVYATINMTEEAISLLKLASEKKRWLITN